MKPYKIWPSTFLKTHIPFTHTVYLDRLNCPREFVLDVSSVRNALPTDTSFASNIPTSTLAPFTCLSYYHDYFLHDIYTVRDYLSGSFDILFIFYIHHWIRFSTRKGTECLLFSFASSVPRRRCFSCILIIRIRESTEHFVCARVVIFRPRVSRTRSGLHRHGYC